MDTLLTVVALCLMGTFAAGLVRVARGPTRADRMMAAQLFGTTGVAIIVLVAHLEAMPRLVDVALVLALLTVLTAVAFVRRAWGQR